MLTRHETPKVRAIRTSPLWVILAIAGMLLALPTRASAQGDPVATDKWQVDLSPLYLSASELDGRLSVGSRTVPIFMEFSDAAEQLAGVFTAHVEARRNRWGVLGDINFVRLSSDTTFTIPGRSSAVDGTMKIQTVVLEAGASYLVNPTARFSVIGGVRTYTFGAELAFDAPASELTPIDQSRTAASAFGGFTYRPRLSEKWTLRTRADLGAGSAFTWSGTIGLEYRFKPWGSVGFGYRALGIDTGDANEGTGEVEYDVTHYGPMVGMTMHLGQK